MLSRRRRYAFEFRHPSWYEDDVIDLLSDANVALCISDHQDAPAPWVATADLISRQRDPDPPETILTPAALTLPCARRRLCPLRQPQENHLMERTELFDLMDELKLYGMKDAFDEIMTTAVKRQHEPQRIVGDLLKAEISEKQARSIKYQLKDLDDFQFGGTPINAGQRPGRWGLLHSATQRRAGRRNRHRQVPSCHRHCQNLHSIRGPRPVLQRRRSRQPAREPRLATDDKAGSPIT
jgi:hypothetical protein